MNQSALPPSMPTDDVLFVQGFYWACVKGHLHGGYESRGAALVRLAKEQANETYGVHAAVCDCVFWQIGGNCTKCGKPMSEKVRAAFQQMIDADNPQQEVKKRQVTLPVLKIEKNTNRYFYFKEAMHTGKKIDDQKEAATIAHAIDLATGEEGLVICPAVMVKELNEAYPANGYVGKCFELILTRVPDKRYNLVSLCVDWREMRLAQRALLQSSGPVVIGPDGRVDVVATEIARAT